ncbi:MAG: tRNA dihydrouridine synthase, partial [bacterium]
AVVRVSPVPVSVKFRKGFDNGSVNAVPFAQMCEGAGASFLAVHGRTRSQMYAGRADRDSIKAVKAAVRIPVYANGDVFSAEDAVRLLRYTGADGVMIARGAMGAPWLFREAKAALAGEPIPAPPSYEERLRLAKRQFALAAADRGEKVACLEARKHLAWYLRGMPHAAFFREKVMSVSTLADIDAVSREIEDALRGERRRGHDT